ncbi:hypothetical protein ABW636_05035 [Aquimarina sp. 2201CG1-2-11]|uniref:hypothetical protein n=1 Tax=Aquimarina discodermiae TaxID=3231043 RepID=UPI003462CB7C
MMWTRTYTNISIIFTILVVVFHIIMFPEYTMPLFILLGGVGTIFVFFVALWQYPRYWLTTKGFIRKLFIHSVVYRILGVIVIYLLTLFFDPASLPFEIKAVDSINYNTSGLLAGEAFQKGESVFKALSGFWKNESDYGFSIVIGFLYYLFGSYPLVVKIFNVLVGSFTVIRIYQITRHVYNEERARLAGILMMLMPPLIWFIGMALKETLLIFIIVNIAYLITKQIFVSGFKLGVMGFIIFQIAITLYFRTIMAPLLLICLLLQIMFIQTSNIRYRVLSVFISGVLIYASYLVVGWLGMLESIEMMIEASQDQFGSELSHAAEEKGISYTAAIISPLLIAGAMITPFPSLLNFEEAQLGIYVHFYNEIIRNCLYFFVFFGLIRILKQFRKGIIFMLSFVLGYIMILAISGISFQDRFQILALPFLIVFMADGIYTHYPKKTKHWKIYLFFIFAAILMWNLFKLSNRGLL